MTAAFFDVDGTLLEGNIVRYYVHLRTRSLSGGARLAFLLGYLPTVVRWLILDRIDRRRMNVEFYRGYRGLDAGELAAAAAADYHALLGRHVYPAARARVQEHRARGEAVVLLTGSLDFIVAPLSRDLGADDLIAVSMRVGADGKLSGELLGPPLAHAEKAKAARAHAERTGIDLAKSWAYGDSASDLDLLELVGHPVVVNPDRGLADAARARRFPVERWRRA